MPMLAAYSGDTDRAAEPLLRIDSRSSASNVYIATLQIYVVASRQRCVREYGSP